MTILENHVALSAEQKRETVSSTAAGEFLRGKPVVYSGFDGKLYTARYANGERNGLGVGSLEIMNAAGKVVRGVLMGEHGARAFFWNLDAEAA